MLTQQIAKKNYAEISKFAAGDKISVKDLNASAVTASDKNLDLTNYNDVKNLLSDKTDAVAINDAAGNKAYIWQVLSDTDARLVAIVDKKLKVSGNSFVYDGKAPAEPAGTTSTIKYVSGSTALDINEGNYGTGTKTQFFDIPANEKDVLKVVLDGSYSQIGSLTVTDSGNNKGTVEVRVLDGANRGTNINVTAVKDKIYLGEERNNLDASNYTFIGADALVANTTGKLTVAFASLGTGANNKAKLDLTNVNANVTISGDVTNGTDVNTLFVNASGNDTITLVTDITNAQSITLTDAAENVTVKTAIAADADLTNMLKGAAANDTISAKIGTDGDRALSLTLSNAKDTIDVLNAKGTGGALTITTTGFDKANDKIDFGASATKGELQKTQITEQDTIKFITVTNGVLTLSGDADIANDKLTITNALAALSKNEAKDKLLNKVLFFTDKDNVNYLITQGANNTAPDDVAIKLTGVTTEGFEIANGIVTLA